MILTCLSLKETEKTTSLDLTFPLGFCTLLPFSVVQTACCTMPNSPSPSVLLMLMESTGMSCLPGGRTMVEIGREMRCSGGEGLSDRVDGSPPPERMIAWKQMKRISGKIVYCPC